MAVKIMMIGNPAAGFRFYGPLPEDDGDFDYAGLEEEFTLDLTADQAFYIDVHAIPDLEASDEG